MKQEVLARKNIVFALVVLSFISIIHDVGSAEPAFVEGETATREIAENMPIHTKVGDPLIFTVDFRYPPRYFSYSLEGTDEWGFKLDVTVDTLEHQAQLKTRCPLNYESKNAYEVKIVVYDPSWKKLDAVTVRINVTDVNEAPRFVETHISPCIRRFVPEGTAPGRNIGDPVSASDPDGPEVALIYTLSSANAIIFQIDSVTGQLRTKMPLDCDTFKSNLLVYCVKVMVSDGELSTETEVKIYVEPVNEYTPMFVEDERTTREIYDTTEIGANIGEPVLAKDMDTCETLEYSLSAANTDMFGIDSVTGQLKLKRPLDYETKSVHKVEVSVSDGVHTNSTIVTIQVLTELVEIPDPSLAWSIRRELGLGDGTDITKKNMLELATLNASLIHPSPVPEIRDLTGLEYATNLTQLECIGNVVVDLTPLAGLMHLRILHLENNPGLSDVSPLAGLVNLEILGLGGCPIENLTPLAGLAAKISIDGAGGSAPSMNADAINSLLGPTLLMTSDREALQARLQELVVESDGSLKYQHAIATLETVLASMRPDKTALMPNYPNPFNPETWIPYHLGKSANVQITIYNVHGTIVRHLELGHQSAGYYTSRNRSVYWDGCNDFGEHVASGIYFYQLQADTISPLRKMVILK